MTNNRGSNKNTTFAPPTARASATPLPTSALAVEVTAHRPVLRSGLRWLYKTEQPAGAAVDDNGERLGSAGNRTLSFLPTAWADQAVIILSVTRVVYRPHPWMQLTNPLQPGELEALAALLTEMGEQVVHTCNGHSSTSGSLTLARPTHPSMRAAVKLYQAGCRTHGGDVFCRCGWLVPVRRGRISLRDIHDGEQR